MNFLPKPLIKLIASNLRAIDRLNLRLVCKRCWQTLFIGEFWLKIEDAVDLPSGHYVHLANFGANLDNITIDKLITKVKFLGNFVKCKVKNLKIIDHERVVIIDFENIKLKRLSIKGAIMYKNTDDIEKFKFAGLYFFNKINYVSFDGKYDGGFIMGFEDLDIPHVVFKNGELIFSDDLKYLRIEIHNSNRVKKIKYPANLKLLTLYCQDHGKIWVQDLPKSLKKIKTNLREISGDFEIKFK